MGQSTSQAAKAGGEHASEATRVWRWMERRLREAIDLGRQSESRGQAAFAQWHGLRASMVQYRRRLVALGKPDAATWRKRFFLIADGEYAVVARNIVSWHDQAEGMATAQEAQDAAERREAYKRAIKEASSGAASLIHRLSKPLIAWQPASGDHRGQLMCPEAAAEAEADKWGTIWEADDKEEQGAERPWMQPIWAAEREQLPAICPSDLRAAACMRLWMQYGHWR